MLVQVTTKLGQSFNLIDKDFADYDFKSNVTSSNDFELGGAIPNCFDFSIFDHNFKQYQLYGARIKVYLDDTPLNTKLLGEFTINSVDIEQALIACKSDDDLSNISYKASRGEKKKLKDFHKLEIKKLQNTFLGFRCQECLKLLKLKKRREIYIQFKA